MAKDDYHVIVYQILSYLYRRLKKGEHVDAAMLAPESPLFKVNYYNIGNCQHAEAICFAMEKMHALNRDYLTEEEWKKMVQLAIDNYPELEWEDGGYGDFKQFDFVRRATK